MSNLVAFSVMKLEKSLIKGGACLARGASIALNRGMNLQELAKRILEEDEAQCDITTRALGAAVAEERLFRVVAKQAGVFSGKDWLEALAELVPFKIVSLFDEGQSFGVGASVLEARANCGDLLAVERSLLNVLQQLCGVATMTHDFVSRVETAAKKQGIVAPKVFHTRKTLPLLREIQIAAVLAGGGALHRRNLKERMLFKDNHKYFVEHSGENFASFLQKHLTPSELSMALVEVDSLDEALAMQRVGVRNLMLDNFSPEQIRVAVKSLDPSLCLEVSGGIRLDTIADFVIEGVDRISVGALTHSVKAVDLSMEIEQ